MDSSVCSDGGEIDSRKLVEIEPAEGELVAVARRGNYGEQDKQL